MDAGGLRLFLLEPAMGFGRPRLIMAPVVGVSARLPSGVHAVEGFVAFPSSSTSSSRRSSSTVVAPALPRGGGCVLGILFGAPLAGAGNALESSSTGRRGVGSIGAALTRNSNPFPPYVAATSSSRRSSQVIVAGLTSGGGRVPGFLFGSTGCHGVGSMGAALTTNSHPFLPFATPSSRRSSQAAAAGLPRDGDRVAGILYGAPIGGPGSTGRRGFDSIGAALTSNSYPDEDDDDDASKPVYLFGPKPRSNRDIASWITLARLQTTFEVAFDAGVLESGRDLRRVLDAIGDIDITAPARPWSLELCSDRICAVIGQDKLRELLEARTPFEDKQFGFSAFAAQSMIEPTEHLMVILHSLIHPVVPNFVLCSSCPVILKQLLKAVCEFSTLIESTKFRRPQSSIRYPMLEAHALALEHVCGIALDVYEEACQEEPKEEWAGLRQGLRNRRTTLFEQDIGLLDYILSIGVTDTERVCDLLLKVAIGVRASAGSSS